MRKVNYEVRRADGTKFFTANYKEATEAGNRIERTYLTHVDEKTAEQHERDNARVAKVWSKAKRG